MSSEAPSAPRGRWRGCLLGGCVLLIAAAVVPPVLLWAFASTVEEVPDRRAERQHALPAGPGRIVLDVSMAELEVAPGPAGTPLRLEASWNPGRQRLEQGMSRDAKGWVYRLQLTGRGPRSWIRSQGHTDAAELRLTVPEGHPLSLAGEIGMGSSDLELGGLALRTIEVELGMGDHRLAFGRPLPAPLELLEIDFSMGELEVSQAGNASPRRLAVEHSMGDFALDLAGAWQEDGRVELEIGMGSCRVDLPSPQQASAVVERSAMTMGSRTIEEHDDDAPVPGVPSVRISASGGMGELTIR